MVVVRSDGVLFAKNSDRDPNEAQALDWQPRRQHAAGARVRCTWIEIPQVRETLAVLLSRPYWMWGAEIGTNEHGVTIGNEAVFTRQPYAASGLTGMDLLRLALERAASAEEGVQTIVALLEEHGQGGSCSLAKPGFTYHNSFLVADTSQAFVLETAGRLHAVEEVHGARSISNGLTIEAFARQQSDTIKTYVTACRARRGRTQPMAERAASAADLMQGLRDHGNGSVVPHYSWLNGGLGAPCVHAGGLVAASQTTHSWVAELKPNAIQHWVTGTAAPCTSLFKPVRLQQPLDLGPWPTGRADHSLWWKHELLHRRVLCDPARLSGYYRERDALEQAWLAAPPEPGEAWRMAAEYEARWLETVSSAEGPDTRPSFVRRYWATRNGEARLALGAGLAAGSR